MPDMPLGLITAQRDPGRSCSSAGRAAGTLADLYVVGSSPAKIAGVNEGRTSLVTPTRTERVRSGDAPDNKDRPPEAGTI